MLPLSFTGVTAQVFGGLRRYASIALSGKSFLIPTLKIHAGHDPQHLLTDLNLLVKRAPGVYRGAALVLDASSSAFDPAQLEMIAGSVRKSGFSIAGITGIAASVAHQVGLPALMTASRQSTSVSAAAASGKAGPTVVHVGNVRGGQQIYGSNGSGVTVLGSVHPGGEVIADGDIHVFGALHGRALAGA